MALKSNSQYKLLVNKGYAVGDSETHKDPLWSAYRVPAEPVQKIGPRPNKFKVDERTEAKVRHDHYNQKPPRLYDRGHMAPNLAVGSRYGQDAQLETFLMSNICPQRATLNQQTWRSLESTIANEYSHDFKQVWVVTGPVFGSQPQKLNDVAIIPKTFYTIVVDAGGNGRQLRMLGVVMDQSVQGIQSLRKYVKTVREIEKQTGLDFFPALPDEIEKVVESSFPDEEWDIDQLLVPTAHRRN